MLDNLFGVFHFQIGIQHGVVTGVQLGSQINEKAYQKIQMTKYDISTIPVPWADENGQLVAKELCRKYNRELASPNEFVAVGEIGMDLYWDKTFLREQQRVLDKQIEWALEYGLPVVLHCREAFDHIYNVLKPYQQTPLKGIFHSFTGTSEEACRIMEFADFMIGINGVVTFKKSTLPEVLKNIPLERIVLETDSPYLTPVPNRGKRNESAYVKDTLVKVAGIYGNSPEKVAQVTSDNALKVFGMLK
jgi:TatD DNase family protein